MGSHGSASGSGAIADQTGMTTTAAASTPPVVSRAASPSEVDGSPRPKVRASIPLRTAAASTTGPSGDGSTLPM